MRGRPGRTIPSITAMMTTTRERLKADAARLVEFAMATTKARMLQAVTSSIAAQVMAVKPRNFLDSPRSLQVQCEHREGGNAHDMPMNSANAVKLAPGWVSDSLKKLASTMPRK